jgi:valyl-tRNA synthetase
VENTGYPQPITSVDDLPKNYEGLTRERFWQQHWLASGIYKFEPARPDGTLRTRDEIFSVDTPPPTVSGALHIGHVYSYTQTDMNVRYQRMRGKHIFYPFGFDDNGLPTERLVEKVKGVRAHEVSREEFIAMCQEVVQPTERQFIDLWQSLALSCDWDQFYTTIDARSRAISQASFIDLYNKGYIYRKVAPTQWDWVNQTAIAQAEIEDREVPGHFHFIKFQWADGPGQPVRGEFVIGTTRPELIPACVAVMVNPESDQVVRDHEGNSVLDAEGREVRQVDLIGKVAITPLFEVEVPILSSEKADPEKGTGILMCCTFGDQEDVEHWQQFNLPTRVIIGKDGRLLERLSWLDNSRDSAAAEAAYGHLAGQKVKQARESVRGQVTDAGALIGLKEITHVVRHAERGDVPVEILVTPQWYVNLLDHKQALLEQGRKVNWHPEYMRKRYEQWVEGLNSDWCISRQRYNGVPFPVWYDASGEPQLAELSALPVNPLTDQPAGTAESLVPDPDVMDTWATSSVSPLLNTHLLPGADGDSARHAQLFPYDMRPQAHDIIRTWAFYTIAKSYFHFGEIPWQDIVISGHAQDASKQKMSKSKGNVVTPAEMVRSTPPTACATGAAARSWAPIRSMTRLSSARAAS